MDIYSTLASIVCQNQTFTELFNIYVLCSKIRVFQKIYAVGSNLGDFNSC